MIARNFRMRAGLARAQERLPQPPAPERLRWPTPALTPPLWRAGRGIDSGTVSEIGTPDMPGT